MIDVHCLVHKESPYFSLLKTQMDVEKDIHFYDIDNGCNIGLGRVNGFRKGDSPYVSYVDYDDLIEPGIFSKINDVMNTGVQWCYTDEIIIDENGKHLQPGWSSNPELYKENILGFVRVNENECVHHILTFRRELLTPKICYIMKQLYELSEEYLRAELVSLDHTHIREIGYYWRQHQDNSMKKFECYENIERIANDKRMDA